MRGLVYRGARQVAVEEVPDTRIEKATGAIVRITTTNIRGSDLHRYEGRTGVEEGTVLGHENMGIVEEVGGGVDFVEVGNRVSVPFDIACGRCRSGHQGWTSFCERVDPIEGMQGVAYGYADTGPYAGGQAELLRVPFADVNLLPLPSGTEHENDFTMLSDIFPTAWHGTVLAGVRPGDAVAVFGVRAGRSAGRAQRAHPGRPTGVQRRRPRRPAHAGRVDGVDPGRRPHTGGPVEQILDATGGVGADCGVEAAGACRRTTPPAPSTSSSSSTTWSRT